MSTVLRALLSMTHKGDSLPSTVLRKTVTPDRRALAEYNIVCGFRVSDLVGPTYPHVLGFPLQMELMTASDFPFPVIGLVHVANRITVHRPLLADEELELTVRAEDLRDHEKGRQFDLVTEARVGEEVVWQDWSTYLRRSGSSSGSGGGGSEPPKPSAVWSVPADTGRRYAAVSGDANPIHLYPLTARVFGFQRAIAHGMWTKARCLAAMEGRLPEAYTVDVRFKLPVLLPAKLAFSWSGTEFALHDAKNGKPHLTGTIS
ncbi:MaoC/PaaZ C-terminal domain-containing protein [Longispora albida]|uniref:MaoC family dehydratase n=1 Tax=Longispora albida TaxID=203523 RepID=UPI0003790377|nr:MaoC/PaaZ C-terminal domain-containing protein [Longispora albida]